MSMCRTGHARIAHECLLKMTFIITYEIASIRYIAITHILI